MDLKDNLQRFLSRIRFRPGMIFGLIIFTALFAFEIFNYSTTDYALRDLLGELRFANVRWATILAIAFCGIDFAGIARLFTPQQGSDEPKEVWYLFGAWLLAATMNAMLTWWGVSMAISGHSMQSTSVMETGTLVKVVPIFVAVMVWVIRILIIGTISTAADHLLWGNKRVSARPSRRPEASVPARPMPTSASPTLSRSNTTPSQRPSYNRPLINPSMNSTSPINSRPEPTYHSMQSNSGTQSGRQL